MNKKSIDMFIVSFVHLWMNAAPYFPFWLIKIHFICNLIVDLHIISQTVIFL